jgi:hypothetical protein
MNMIFREDHLAGEWWAYCPGCNQRAMFEGVEEEEIVVCPHCLEFGAAREIWFELMHSNIIEMCDA